MRKGTLSYFIGVAAAVFVLGVKKVYQEKLLLVGQFALFASIVVSYASVFRWISPGDLERLHLTLPKMIWYVATTETTLFCATIFFKEFQTEINEDLLSWALLRPCPLWVLKIGDWFGQYSARLAVLLLPNILLAYMLSGSMDLGWSYFGAALTGLPLAGVMLLCSHFVVGGSCLWIKQSEPLFWVWQKSGFLFGALLWPLAFYPPVFQKLVWFLPFSALFAATGQWIVAPHPFAIALAVGHQIVFLFLFLLSASKMNDAILRRVQNTGGF